MILNPDLAAAALDRGAAKRAPVRRAISLRQQLTRLSVFAGVHAGQQAD